MRLPEAYVNRATTRKNLFWILAITAIAALHGCAWLQFQAEQDEQDRTERTATNQVHH